MRKKHKKQKTHVRAGATLSHMRDHYRVPVEGDVRVVRLEGSDELYVSQNDLADLYEKVASTCRARLSYDTADQAQNCADGLRRLVL